MARLGTARQKTKPWRAAVKYKYKERFLGYFATKEEAEQAERDMRVRLTGVPHPTRTREW